MRCLPEGFCSRHHRAEKSRLEVQKLDLGPICSNLPSRASDRDFDRISLILHRIWTKFGSRKLPNHFLVLKTIWDDLRTPCAHRAAPEAPQKPQIWWFPGFQVTFGKVGGNNVGDHCILVVWEPDSFPEFRAALERSKAPWASAHTRAARRARQVHPSPPKTAERKTKITINYYWLFVLVVTASTELMNYLTESTGIDE